jgi:4-carboxymuconolactone decarboxylase
LAIASPYYLNYRRNGKESKLKEKVMIKQDAGRKNLGDFAPAFAHYNDDILFGENWNDSRIDNKTRCIVTLSSLISQGITDSSLQYHIINAKNSGVSQSEFAAIVTHIAFYAGWPKAWAAFNIGKKIYSEEQH